MNYIIQRLVELESQAVILTGFDEALIGIDIEGRAVYSKMLLIKFLKREMSEEEALEHYESSVLEGIYTIAEDIRPIIIEDIDERFLR